MKNITILAALLLSLAAQSFAQTNGQALFIYRNDGKPTEAILTADIDSITYSNIDLDGNVCEGKVVQEICLPDTVYRIPVAAIDSVDFRVPKTEYREGTILIDNGLRPYIASVDHAAVYLKSDTPASLVPVKGSRLLTMQCDNMFPNAFAGEVTEVTRSGSGISLAYDSIPLNMAVSRHFSVTEIATAPSGDTGRRSEVSTHHFPPVDITFTAADFGIKAEINDEWSLSADASANLSFSIKPTLRQMLLINGDVVNLSGRLSFDVDWTSSINFAGSVNFDNSTDPREPFPIPQIPWLSMAISPYTFFRASFGGMMTYEAQHRAHADIRYSFSSDPNIKSTIDGSGYTEKVGETTSMLVGTFGIDAGVGLEINFQPTCIVQLNKTLVAALNKDKKDVVVEAKAYTSQELGIRLSGDVPLSKSLFEGKTPTDLTIYDRLKRHSSFSLDLFNHGECGLSVKAYRLTVDPFKTGYDLTLLNLAKWELFPSFSNATMGMENDRAWLETDISDDLLIPLEVGFKVFDTHSTEIAKLPYADKYRGSSTFASFKTDLNDWKNYINRDYKAYPYFSIFDHDIVAPPVTDVSLKMSAEAVGAVDVSSSDATLAGRLGEKSVSLPGMSVGFIYGTSSSATAGTKVYGSLKSDKSFRATARSLKPDTRYYFRAFVEYGDNIWYGEPADFRTKADDEEIDLGLSVNWRGWNLGANRPEQSGTHYAWGETAGKDTYSWDNYFDNPYDESGNWKGASVDTDVAGTALDAASQALGDGWRMPTEAEMRELYDNCTWEWIDGQGGANGYRVTGPNGNSIFLPAAGLFEKSLSNEGAYGAYWTSTPQNSANKATASNLYFYKSSSRSIQWSNRFGGRSIRPVRPR